MPQHRVVVARAFQILGLGTALPASLIAIAMGIAAFVLMNSPVAPKSDHLSVTTYGLVGLLSNAMSGVGEVLSFLNVLAAWASALVAGLALVATLFGGLLFRIGQGLDGSTLWARLVAGAMMVALSLSSLPALCFLKGAGRFAGVAGLALSLYVLWVLRAKYAD